MKALQLLDLMFGANEEQPRKVALNEFYNQALSDSMDVPEEYVTWRRTKVALRPGSLHLKQAHMVEAVHRLCTHCTDCQSWPACRRRCFRKILLLTHIRVLDVEILSAFRSTTVSYKVPSHLSPLSKAACLVLDALPCCMRMFENL